MKLLTLPMPFDSLLRDLTKFAVGFEPMFQRFDQFRQIDTSFPPYNLEKIGDSVYVLSMAVAGFTKDDIELSLYDGVLTVSGNGTSHAATDIRYLHKGIANRNFIRSFVLNAGVEITKSDLKDGLLTVEFSVKSLEAAAPVRIQIGSN